MLCLDESATRQNLQMHFSARRAYNAIYDTASAFLRMIQASGTPSESALERLSAIAGGIAERVLAPSAAAIDREGRWPAEGMDALARAGLLGLMSHAVWAGWERDCLRSPM